MRRNLYRLYDALVADARRPALYRLSGAADCFEARFDMLVLHLVLALRQLRRDADGARASEHLIGIFLDDMDQALRESGAGDVAVGRRVRRMGEAFYGRQRAYDAALDAGDGGGLADALKRNLSLSAEGAARLAAYMDTYMERRMTKRQARGERDI